MVSDLSCVLNAVEEKKAKTTARRLGWISSTPKVLEVSCIFVLDLPKSSRVAQHSSEHPIILASRSALQETSQW